MSQIEVTETHYITLKLTYADAKKLEKELDENAKFCADHGRGHDIRCAKEPMMCALYNCLTFE